MKYLNLGCGSTYSSASEWTNLDFVSNDENVIAHNLLAGIPFENNTFDLVYHSHVLEHFAKEDGEQFIQDCFRVLKPSGIIRIAIPDLETIVREYIKNLEYGINHPDDKNAEANYNWIMLELFDQTVRNKRGGNMGKYLTQEKMPNETYIYNRIGQEGKSFRENFLAKNKNAIQQISPATLPFKQKIKNKIFSLLKINPQAQEIGVFRLSGEIHQWMYDRYSLGKLLQKTGFQQIEIKTATTSYLQAWKSYALDANKEIVRKPDSLFIEAIKP